jgi:hypothetical protein
MEFRLGGGEGRSGVKKSLIYAVSGGVAILAWALSGEIGRFVGKSAVDRYLQGQSRGVVEMAQEAAAKELREQLPMRIDDLTTLERVMSAGSALIYQYRVDFTERDIDNSWHAKMKSMLAANVCRQSDMRVALKDGASYQYTYIGNDGFMIAEFVVTGSDC